MKYSEAILMGSNLTEQAFGYWIGTDGKACANGAAMQAAGFTIKDMKNNVEIIRMIKDRFPEADAKLLIDSCPGVPEQAIYRCQSYRRHSLLSLVIHLNDFHQWTRPRIAYWIRDHIEAIPVQVPVLTSLADHATL